MDRSTDIVGLDADASEGIVGVPSNANCDALTANVRRSDQVVTGMADDLVVAAAR